MIITWCYYIILACVWELCWSQLSSVLPLHHLHQRRMSFVSWKHLIVSWHVCLFSLSIPLPPSLLSIAPSEPPSGDSNGRGKKNGGGSNSSEGGGKSSKNGTVAAVLISMTVVIIFIILLAFVLYKKESRWAKKLILNLCMLVLQACLLL